MRGVVHHDNAPHTSAWMRLTPATVYVKVYLCFYALHSHLFACSTFSLSVLLWLVFCPTLLPKDKNKLGLRLGLRKGLYSSENILREELDPKGEHVLSGLIPQGTTISFSNGNDI